MMRCNVVHCSAITSAHWAGSERCLKAWTFRNCFYVISNFIEYRQIKIDIRNVPCFL